VRLSKWACPKITSGQSKLTLRRIAAVDEWFNRIRQVAAVCPPMIVHWRHLANTIEFVLPSAYPSPQPKRQIDRFSRFCTAHGRKCRYFTMGAPIHQNCPFPWRIWTPSNTWFLGPMRAHNPNGTSIGSAVFAQMTAERLYTLQWFARCLLKVVPSHAEIWTPCNIWYLGPPKSSNQTASRSLLPFLQCSLM